MFRTNYIIIILVLLFAYPVNAQWNFNLGSYSTIDDNAFRNYNKISDIYQTFYLYLSRDISFKSSNIRAYYSGSKTYFDKFRNRNYSSNGGSLVFTKSFRDEKYILNIGGNVDLINFNDFYQIFDSKNLKFFNNIRFSTNNSLYIGGITSEYLLYPNLESQNNIKTNVFLRWQKYYESRTTLKTNLLYGYNHYFNKSAFIGDELEFVNSSALADRISFEFLVAQSITDLLGISLNLEYSKILHNSERYIKINSDYIYSEEEIFNVPFDYNLYDVSLQLTKVFQNSISAQIIGTLQNRDYINQRALDLNGSIINENLLRQDNRKLLNFNISKKFDVPMIAVKSFTVGLSIFWLKNESNDPYYNYGNLLSNINFAFSF